MLLRGHRLATEHDLLVQLSQSQPWWLTAGAFALSAQPAAPMTPSSNHQPQQCWRPYFRLQRDTDSAGASSAPDTGACAAVQRLPLWHSAVRAAGSVGLISDPRCSLSLWCGISLCMLLSWMRCSSQSVYLKSCIVSDSDTELVLFG